MGSWVFEGNGQQIGFSVSENGILSAYGHASQDCQPDDDVAGIVPLVKDLPATWRIVTPASKEAHYDSIGGGHGLKKFFAQNGEQAAGMILHCPDWIDELLTSNSSMALTILAPNDFAASAFTMLKAAMGNASFRFHIVAEFQGLSVGSFTDAEAAPSKPGIPKVDEFFAPNPWSCHPYFSRSICMTVRTF
jgi:hypothetical protein